MNLLFSDKVSQAFADKVISISNKLAIDPNWLMFLMDWEDASTFSPSNENSFGCIGLIQFCPDYQGADYKTIGGVQYKMSIIKAMTAEEQLDLVYEYLNEIESSKGKFADYYQLYFGILFPDAYGKPDNYVLNTQSNPVFDLNKDGKITVLEIKNYLDARVQQKVPTQYLATFFKKKTFLQLYKREILFWGGISALVILYILYRRISK